jgi:hypothetical protein
MDKGYLIESDLPMSMEQTVTLLDSVKQTLRDPQVHLKRNLRALQDATRACGASKTTRNVVELLAKYSAYRGDLGRYYDQEIDDILGKLERNAGNPVDAAANYVNLKHCLLEFGKSREESEAVWREAVPLLKAAGYDVEPRTVTLRIEMPPMPVSYDSQRIADRVQRMISGSAVHLLTPDVELGSRRRRKQRSGRSKRSHRSKRSRRSRR